MAFNQRITYEKGIVEARNTKEISLTFKIEKALKVNKKAWKNFNNLAPNYRKQYVGWIMGAKRQDTIKETGTRSKNTPITQNVNH